MSTSDNMMPPQASSIDRTPAGQQAFISEAGVDASAWYDDVISVGGSLLGGFL